MGAGRLRTAGIESPRLEARLLLAHSLGLTPEALLAEPETAVEPAGYEALLARRAAREPLALILGRREFWSLDFAVSAATLIPRPDSETLIEAALAQFAGHAAPNAILDLGTGTGCLLLAALHEFPSARGLGLDRSAQAAELARRNAQTLGLAGRAAFACGNWADPVNGRFDLIFCNPPYIATGDLPRLMPEVTRFDPRSALDGGPDGLEAYRSIIPDLPRLLARDGAVVLELGQGQARAVELLAQSAGLTTLCRMDLAGIPRALVLRNALP